MDSSRGAHAVHDASPCPAAHVQLPGRCVERACTACEPAAVSEPAACQLIVDASMPWHCCKCAGRAAVAQLLACGAYHASVCQTCLKCNQQEHTSSDSQCLTYPSPASTHRQFTGGREYFYSQIAVLVLRHAGSYAMLEIEKGTNAFSSSSRKQARAYGTLCYMMPSVGEAPECCEVKH